MGRSRAALHTEGVEHRRLAPDHALRTLPAGQAVVIYGSMAPLRVTLRPWYADPTLSERARQHGDLVAPAGVPSWAAPIPPDAIPADASIAANAPGALASSTGDGE